jgi:hypothetical protein
MAVNGRAETREEALEQALNGFIWLGNNLHNKDRPLFDEMYRACLVDARTALAFDPARHKVPHKVPNTPE